MATAVREFESEPRHDQIVDLAADRHIKVNEHLYIESPDERCGDHLDGEIGVSFGIATSEDLDGKALVAEADRELLAAKDRLYSRG